MKDTAKSSLIDDMYSGFDAYRAFNKIIMYWKDDIIT